MSLMERKVYTVYSSHQNKRSLSSTICVSLKIEITYPYSKDRSDLVGTLAQLVARKMLNLVLLESQAGRPRRQNM